MDRNDKEELDDLRLTVGHVALLVRLGHAVIAMRDADRDSDHLIARAEAYDLVGQWEKEHPDARR